MYSSLVFSGLPGQSLRGGQVDHSHPFSRLVSVRPEPRPGSRNRLRVTGSKTTLSVASAEGSSPGLFGSLSRPSKVHIRVREGGRETLALRL